MMKVAVASESKSPQQLLAWFADEWDDSNWGPGKSRGYMRSLDDRGWQARMKAMRELATHGKDAVKPLVKALQSKHTPTRILAAQTLGFLARHIEEAPLMKAAVSDTDAAVRLYAVDALGMRGNRRLAEQLAPRTKAEKNGDVRKHLAYAEERKGEPADTNILRTFTEWDPKTMNTARVGAAAPDFTLATLSGKKYRLSDFRGKQAVVLVFIYGDT